MEQDNILQQNFDIFLEKAQQLSQGIFDTETVHLQLQNTIAQTVLPLKKQQRIDSLAQMLAKELNVNILYSLKSNDGKDFKTMLYAMPYEDESYVIELSSVMYGITGKVNLTFFSSLDVMFNTLNSKYQNIDHDRWKILKLQRPEVFFSKFTFTNS